MNALLLDTCTFLWIVANAPELSEKARATFYDLENQVYLSAVSAWEIAVKNALGKLPLPDTADTAYKNKGNYIKLNLNLYFDGCLF